jgi:DNA repair protein RAD51/nuclear pore complex protein Nup160
MATGGGACLYQEARLNIEPAFPGSTISLTLPALVASTFGARTQPKRTIITEQYSGQDEDAFARRHLASDGGLFFRRHHQYPRSFLWRILDNRKVLEIQSVDLEQDATHDVEANLTLLLQFTAPIRPFCVAFAEPDDRDVLTVFAITSANEFYTITLHREFFMKPAASELDIDDWCKRSTLNALTFRLPYRLVARSSDELLITLDNGGILYLTKKNKEDVIWDEAIYQQESWLGSLRGILTLKGPQTVQFETTELYSSAAAAVAFSPDPDREHIITVCLDHKLRAWNRSTGKPGMQKDILGESERPNDRTAHYLINPSQSQLMQIVNTPGRAGDGTYHVVTYSPKQHQFKFWAVRDADAAEQGIYDAQPEFNFVPPVDTLMNTSVWTLEEFFLIPGSGWKGTQLWLRARSGPSCRVYSLKFNLFDDAKTLAATWEKDWVSVDSGPLSIEGLRQNPSNPGEWDPEAIDLFEVDLTQKWLEFLFFPERFTPATLEAALVVYRKGLERGQNAQSASRGSLKERICGAVGTFATLEQGGDVERTDFERSLAAQWQAYYGLVKDLHKRRAEYLSLAYDDEREMPWIVLSDHLSAVRECAVSEVIALNASTLSSVKTLPAPLRKMLDQKPNRKLDKTLEVSRLLIAAASFRKNLPTTFQSQLQREVNSELLQSRSLSIVDRMELMEQNSDLSRQVSDEDVVTLVEELGMDMKDVRNDTFLGAMEILGEEEKGRAPRNKQIARFGLHALVRVSQETLEARYNILLDLLVLILFMQFEEDLADDFDPSLLFAEIIDGLKDCTLLRWLAGIVWSNPTTTGPSSENSMKQLDDASRKSRKSSTTQTVLEGLLGHRSFELAFPNTLKTNLLTYWSRVWLAQIFKGMSYEAALEDVMGILLMQKEYLLASQFSKFMSDDNWATYLKGRMHLALGENALASICFQKAAFNLGKPLSSMKERHAKLMGHPALGMFSLEEADQINFISVEHRDSFSDGLAEYYYHIVGLFEKHKAYSFVADFAHMGLKSIDGPEEEPLKKDLLSRLFSASIQTHRFEDAYSAMIRNPDDAL